jgi:hypothetical protein
MAPHRHGWIDRSAMSLSGLCLVHCLAGSVLLSTISISGGLLSHSFHFFGLLFALPLAAYALVRGVRQHGRVTVVLLGGLGLALMALSLFVGHGTGVEIGMSVTGVVALGCAHLLNLRWSRH